MNPGPMSATRRRSIPSSFDPGRRHRPSDYRRLTSRAYDHLSGHVVRPAADAAPRAAPVRRRGRRAVRRLSLRARRGPLPELGRPVPGRAGQRDDRLAGRAPPGRARGVVPGRARRARGARPAHRRLRVPTAGRRAARRRHRVHAWDRPRRDAATRRRPSASCCATCSRTVASTRCARTATPATTRHGGCWSGWGSRARARSGAAIAMATRWSDEHLYGLLAAEWRDRRDGTAAVQAVG